MVDILTLGIIHNLRPDPDPWMPDFRFGGSMNTRASIRSKTNSSVQTDPDKALDLTFTRFEKS